MRRQYFALAALMAALSIDSAASAAEFAVVNADNSGPGSLRQAIENANATPGHDRIVFNIPAQGVQMIPVTDAPLTVTDSLTIDGYTQPGGKPNTLEVGSDAVLLIELRAVRPTSVSSEGLVLNAANCTVRGLSITGFLYQTSLRFASGAAIVAAGSGGHTIEGNYIGLNANGATTFETRNYTGIALQSDANTVGGLTPAARNVVAGNTLGILSRSARNRILGNYVGTDRTGSSAIRNEIGIVFRDGPFTETVVGGRPRAAANVISGNGTGITVFVPSSEAPNLDPAARLRIEGNLIGLAANGLDPLGNAGGFGTNVGDGILVTAANVSIGGLEPGAGNVIAYNGGDGVEIATQVNSSPVIGNTILSNRIFSNAQTERGARNINVAPRNDIGDADLGANNRQNFPIILGSSTRSPDAPPGGFNFNLFVGLNSTPLTEFTVQAFHYRPQPELLGTMTVGTDAAGNARLRFLFYLSPGTPAPEGSFFAATATDPNGNTSELTPQNGAVHLANIATRGRVGLGDNIMIGGFITRSAGEKRLLIRALGPSVNAPDTLDDPFLEIFDGNGRLLAKNDDWKAGQQEEVRQTGAAPTSDVESALIVTVPAGNYTAHVTGVNGGTGTALIEVYDLDFRTDTSGRLINISTRGFVGTGDNVLIGGVIAPGDAAQRVIVRAIGPDVGAPGALQDPVLELRDAAGELVAQNDNWRDQQEAEIQQTQLAPNDDRDAAIVATLIPANYTAIVHGKNGTTGVALVEFYDLKN